MARAIDLAAEAVSLEVPQGMEGRVNGVWGGVLCSYICRNCVAMSTFIAEEDAIRKYDTTMNSPAGTTPKLSDETRAQVDSMRSSKSGVLDGRECMNPTKKYVVAGRLVCHGKFYADA